MWRKVSGCSHVARATRNMSRIFAMAAGLSSGSRWPFASMPAPSRCLRPALGFAPNAFIRIGSDNVVRLWAVRSEMGQGVRTLLPMVLADELEADWEKVVIEQARMEPRFKGIRLRTSGSGSAAGTWGPLRRAAATAREMLISAAAQQWQVAPDTCRAQNSAVVHVPTGRKLYIRPAGQLCFQGSRPCQASSQRRERVSSLGKRVKRRDGKAIVSGKAIYGLDVKLPGMLYAVVARCPYLGGKLVSCDPAPAMKVAGVKNVVPVHGGFSGGVAVVAKNTWAAIKGRDALQPVWDQGPDAAFDSDSFMRELEQSLSQPGFPIRRQGDAQAALAESATKLEAIYEYPYQAHAPLETMNCTADVRAGCVRDLGAHAGAGGVTAGSSEAARHPCRSCAGERDHAGRRLWPAAAGRLRCRSRGSRQGRGQTGTALVDAR